MMPSSSTQVPHIMDFLCSLWLHPLWIYTVVLLQRHTTCLFACVSLKHLGFIAKVLIYLGKFNPKYFEHLARLMSFPLLLRLGLWVWPPSWILASFGSVSLWSLWIFMTPSHLPKCTSSFLAFMALLAPSSLTHLKLPVLGEGRRDTCPVPDLDGKEIHSAFTEQAAGFRAGRLKKTLPNTVSGPLPHQWNISDKIQDPFLLSKSLRLFSAHQT